MKTITVGFSHSTNLFSKLIMLVTRSQISHAYIRLSEDKVYEASGLSVNEQVYEYFLTYETVVKEIQVELTDEQFAKGEAFRLASLGKPYSVGEVFGFAWILLMKSLGRKVANPFKGGTTSYVCSELVMNYIGMDDSAENMTPEDVYKLLMSNQPA